MKKINIMGTPRKVLYHKESRMLLVMRTELSIGACLSDICCVDPLSGSVLSSFRLDLGETATSMELIRFGSEQVLVVGTSLYSGPPVIPSGEAERYGIEILWSFYFPCISQAKWWELLFFSNSKLHMTFMP
jgi:splicing factor 3B subunit 3